ncbi:xanthine dehydrogenase family protein molybdopterin-binding subunit [Alcaligenes faecalis subsp. faecalis]|uniref:xanthine dehydrogenase family protein molybdopterin-binding subunit n=1 Tax=Alcaligenes faecalis TaxID=511 RepID=UPI001F231DC7|nr:xanthine dehydrogenase family protein molybdopterin-binding subunit [Alcaligenes faecalis]MBW4787623.1 xanthine dehydrogenase family protein molybdopterin-binding subunit [Alcaligenes faecalis subsp. faecalis]
MSQHSHPSSLGGQGVGARILRKEDARHLNGRGNFIGNMTMPGLQEVAFLRSPMAHARIRQINIEDSARAQVITRADMPDCLDIYAASTLPSYQASSMPPLASGSVRYVGEPVAMAFGDSRAVAEDVLEEIEALYDELPVYGSVPASLAAQGDLLHEGWQDNVFVTLRSDVAFEEHAARADRVIEHSVSLSRQCMLPMEGKAVLAYWDFQADQLVVYCGSQIPHMHRTGIAQFLGMDQAQVRVISPDVGGAFGYKCVLHQEELCVAWLAKTFRKPFRFMEDRREHLIAGANTREHQYRLKAHISNDGRLLALDAEIDIDGGAYSVWPFTVGLEVGQALGNLPGPYDFRGYRCRTRGVGTNKPGFMPYRGVARTGVCLAIEQMMDQIALAVGKPSWEIRLMNLVKGEQMPYVNVANKHYDSGDYPESLRRALAAVDVDAVLARQAKGEPDGRLIGLGVASYTEQSAHGTSVFASWGTAVIPGFDQAFVRMTPDGGLEVRVGVHSHGQGMETSFAQIASEILGIPVAKIKVVHGDTGRTPFSTGTYASRSLVMSGGAVSKACKELLPRVRKIAAHMLKADVDSMQHQGDMFSAEGRQVSIAQVADAWYINPQHLPEDVDPQGLELSVGYKPKVDTGSFTYASNAVVVAVDPSTGGVEVLKYVVVEDCGVMINPMIVEGQTIGGIAQGIGTALYEEMPYDEFAQPLASTLADYVMPGACEVPNIHIEHMESPSPNTEFGAKGMGEGGAIAPPAAIMSAINNALRSTGAQVSHTPVTPHRLLSAIRAAAQPANQQDKQPVSEVQA